MSAKFDRESAAAVGLLGLGLVLAAWGSASGTGKPGAAGELVPAMVATRGLRAGERLEREMLEVRELPASLGARRYVAPETVAACVGRELAADLAAGEPLLRTDLVVRDGALADRVPAGKLALAIEADFVAGVAGRLAVGDVVVVTEAGAATSMALEVLALGVPTGEAGYRAVVVAVDGDQAARIAGLRGRGPIVLALRGTKTRAGEERP